MTTTREDIMAEAAEWLATPGLVMVDELTDITGSPRTVFVGAARVNGVEGIVHVVQKGRIKPRLFAQFRSDEAYRRVWGLG
jgi:hypothetical protein